MKIYIDLILFINFCFDFILLFGVGYILKRKIIINKLILSSFLGSFTVLFLFFDLNSFLLFIFKFFIAFIMVIFSYGFRSILFFIKNFIMFYVLSIFLGGFLYFINIQFSIKTNGFVFFNNGFSINIVFLLFVSPIVIYLYINYLKKLKDNNFIYYNISFNLKNHLYNLIGFLDTGCKIRDPYGNRPIVLVGKNVVDFSFEKYILVPYTTIDSEGMIKCIRINQVYVNEICCKNVLIGFLDKNIGLDGVDCIIQSNLLEGYSV